MKKIFILLFVVFSLKNYGQDKYEYFGALKLNGNDKTIITYRLVFTQNKGSIQGYSITDLGGNNETKNTVTGTYDPTTKLLNFREDDILYTKSTFSEKSFCFVNFSGKVKFSTENTKIQGSFSGLYKNKKKCINGTIALIGSVKIYKFLNKVKTKIQNSNKVDELTKKKVNPLNILDSLKVNNLLKDQNLNVFIKSDSVDIEIWDPKEEDGDIIMLFQNDKLILDHYIIKSKKKKISVVLDKNQNVFRIEAVNEGAKFPNTAEIQIIDLDRLFELKSNLKQGEKASITLIKKND